MVDGGDFVDGTSVDVRRVVATLVGGILISWYAGMWRFVEMLTGLIGRFYTAPAEVGLDLVMQAITIPIDALEVAWAEAASWVAGPGASLGPWLFPLAVLVTATTLLLLDWGIDRMGVLD